MKTYKIVIVKTVVELYEISADDPFDAMKNYISGDKFASYTKEIKIDDIEETV